MSDNVNIIVQDTINEIVVNTAVIVETIDINVQTPIDEVTIITNPNNYIVNINRVIGQQVQSDWNQNDSQEPDYIKNKPTIPGAQEQSDWNETDINKPPYIKNKPAIPTQTSDLINNGDGSSGSYFLTEANIVPQVNSDWNAVGGKAEIFNKPTIPAAQVNSDWNATSGKAEILNKPTIPSITNLVPYTGANADVQLGVNNLFVGGRDEVLINETTISIVDYRAGPTRGVIIEPYQFSVTDYAGQNLNIVSNGIQFNDVSFQTTAFPPTGGTSSQYIKGDGTLATFPTLLSADKMVTIGRNSTGSTLYKGTIVYISGSTGNRPNFVKSIASSEAGSAGTFGVIENDIPNNSDGNCVTIGAIDNLDTRSTATHPFTSDTLSDGDTIYLSPTTAGFITNVKPSAPNHLVYIGKVVRTSPTNGTIVYRIQNGYELNEIHDVSISSVANNQLLSYDSATSLWKNKSVTTADIADSTNKRYQTDNQNTYNDATSSIQTQINSKQDALVSGTNIKSVNGISLLGSGDLSVKGVHALVKPSVGSSIAVNVNSGTLSSQAQTANRLIVSPFIPAQTITCSALYINVVTLVAGSNAQILIYSNLNGKPDTKLYQSANLDCSTTGIKTATTTQTFEAGTTYWIGVHTSGIQSISVIAQASLLTIFNSGLTQITGLFITPTYGSAPTTFGTPSNSTGTMPLVGITI